jgi:hypothetical protein
MFCCIFRVGASGSLALARSSYSQDGEVAAARLFRCSFRSRIKKKLAHLACRIA